MLLTGSTNPVGNRLAKNEFLVELDLNEEPACLEMVWNIDHLMTICGY